MATIQQSIDIKVPVHTVYNQLTQFEEYPRFMEEVEAVRQVDDTHLHWTTIMSNRPVEWDAEITEQKPDRCIAWRNTSGPTNAGKVEVQPVGPSASRLTLTLEAEPAQVPGAAAGNSAQEMAQRLKKDLARLKQFIEARGEETGAWRGEVHGGQTTLLDREAGKLPATPAAHQHSLDFSTQEQGIQGTGTQTGSLQSTSGYAAGSEGFSGDEDTTAPITSANRTAAETVEYRNDSAGSAKPKSPQSDTPETAARQEAGDTRTPQTPSTSESQAPGPGSTAASVAASGGTDASAGARDARNVTRNKP